MDNLRQITAAWVMYSSDNNDTFAVNEENATDADGPMPGWVKGSLDYSGSPDNTNLSYLVDSHDALLGSFLQTPAVFKCPADISKTFGQTGAPRVRSFSMNQAVGPGPYGGSAGQGSLLPSPAYRVYTKESDVLHPTPSDLWLLTEEDPTASTTAGSRFLCRPAPFSRGGMICRPGVMPILALFLLRTVMWKSIGGNGRKSFHRPLITGN